MPNAAKTRREIVLHFRFYSRLYVFHWLLPRPALTLYWLRLPVFQFFRGSSDLHATHSGSNRRSLCLICWGSGRMSNVSTGSLNLWISESESTDRSANTDWQLVHEVFLWVVVSICLSDWTFTFNEASVLAAWLIVWLIRMEMEPVSYFASFFSRWFWGKTRFL